MPIARRALLTGGLLTITAAGLERYINAEERAPEIPGYGNLRGVGLVASSRVGASETVVASRSLALRMRFPKHDRCIRTEGYALPGDGGGALYTRAEAEPAHAGKFADGDSNWWEYVPGQEGANAKAFGAQGDGVTNDTLALRDFSAFIEHQDGGNALIPAGRYMWGLQTLAGAFGAGHSWKGLNAVQIHGCARPIVLEMQGVEMRTLPGQRYGSFHPVSGAAHTPSQPFYDLDYRADIGYPLDLRDNASVVIRGFPDLHGDVVLQIQGGGWGDSGWQNHYDGLFLLGNHSVYAEIGSADWFARDGIQIAWPGLGWDDPIRPHVLVLRSAQYNGRQGISYVGGNSLIVNGGAKLSNTGRNGVVRSAPGAGLDIEAEAGAIVTGVVLNDVHIFNNFGAGILDEAGTEGGSLTLNGGVVIGTDSWSLWNRKGRWKINGTKIVGATAYIKGDVDPAKATKVEGGLWSMDPADSPSGVIYGGGSNRMEIRASANVRFTRVVFSAAGPYGIPLSLIGTPPTYQNCVFIQKSNNQIDTQGVFVGLTRFAHGGSAPLNFSTSMFTGPTFINGETFRGTGPRARPGVQ